MLLVGVKTLPDNWIKPDNSLIQLFIYHSTFLFHLRTTQIWNSSSHSHLRVTHPNLIQYLDKQTNRIPLYNSPFIAPLYLRERKLFFVFHTLGRTYNRPANLEPSLLYWLTQSIALHEHQTSTTTKNFNYHQIPPEITKSLSANLTQSDLIRSVPCCVLILLVKSNQYYCPQSSSQKTTTTTSTTTRPT